MVKRAEALENMVGRRTASCVGWALFIVVLLMILALLWPVFFPKSKPTPAPAPPTAPAPPPTPAPQ